MEKPFTKKGERPIPNNSTLYVNYDGKQLLDVQGRIIDRMLDLILMPRGRGLADTTLNAYMMELQMLLSLHTLRVGLFFKHQAYENEKEYRFMQIHPIDLCPKEVKVRSRPYSLVRYLEFDWREVAPDALREILVGPAADRQRASQFAQDCLRSFHVGNVKIGFSQIPYRAV